MVSLENGCPYRIGVGGLFQTMLSAPVYTTAAKGGN
jgi:hypothetical protein